MTGRARTIVYLCRAHMRGLTLLELRSMLPNEIAVHEVRAVVKRLEAENVLWRDRNLRWHVAANYLDTTGPMELETR